MSDLIERQAAIDAVAELVSSMSVCASMDECRGMKNMQERAVRAIADLPSAQPERDGFTTWALSVADSYRIKSIIEKFRDYQVEWLTSHCDLEFCKEEEDAIVRFLHDTADCFEMEVKHETD